MLPPKLLFKEETITKKWQARKNVRKEFGWVGCILHIALSINIMIKANIMTTFNLFILIMFLLMNEITSFATKGLLRSNLYNNKWHLYSESEITTSSSSETTEITTEADITTETTNLNDPIIVDDTIVENNLPQGVKLDDKYIQCGACKSVYIITEKQLGERGRRVHCNVCDKEWYQTLERVMTVDDGVMLNMISEEKIPEIRRNIQTRNFRSRGNGIGIFVGNLPYSYTEEEIGGLFAEYGILQISLVRDAEGESKGFAFLEVATEADANMLIDEMHHFHTDNRRKLTVRLADNNRGRNKDK